MLHSIRIRYDAPEDRLELVIRVQEDSAYRFHMTRRVAVRFAAQLQALAVWSAGVPASVDPVTRSSITAGHHNVLAAQAPIGAAPQPARPLQVLTGERPVLITDVRCGRSNEDGRWVLSFDFGKDQTLNLQLQQSTLHGVIELFRRKLQESDWGLALLAQAPSAAPVAVRSMH